VANQHTGRRGLGVGSKTLIVKVTADEKAAITARLQGLTYSDYLRVRLGLETSSEVEAEHKDGGK